MSKGLKVFIGVIFLLAGIISLGVSRTRDYRGTPDGKELSVAGAVLIPLGILFITFALRKRKLEVEKAISKESSLKRISFTHRLLRMISILWFVVAICIVTSAVCSLAGPRGILFFSLAFAFGVLFIVLSVFVIRRLSMNICRVETPRVVSYNGWLIAIGIAACLVWIRAVPNLGIDLVWQIAYIFGIIAAITVLFKSRLFLFRNYAVAGFAIGSCLATTLYPAMTRMSLLVESSERTQQFTEVINNCSELATESQFYTAMVQETNVDLNQGLEEGVLVLEANGEREPFDLKAHPWESMISKRLLAADPASVRLIVIVASYNWRAQSSTRTKNLSNISGLPVLIFSWPDKLIVGKTKVSIILSKPVSDIWGERFVDRCLASQLEKIITIETHEPDSPPVKLKTSPLSMSMSMGEIVAVLGEGCLISDNEMYALKGTVKIIEKNGLRLEVFHDHLAELTYSSQFQLSSWSLSPFPIQHYNLPESVQQTIYWGMPPTEFKNALNLWTEVLAKLDVKVVRRSDEYVKEEYGKLRLQESECDICKPHESQGNQYWINFGPMAKTGGIVPRILWAFTFGDPTGGLSEIKILDRDELGPIIYNIK